MFWKNHSIFFHTSLGDTPSQYASFHVNVLSLSLSLSLLRMMIITLIALTQSTSKLGLGKAGLSQKNLKLGLSRVAKGFISFQF